MALLLQVKHPLKGPVVIAMGARKESGAASRGRSGAGTVVAGAWLEALSYRCSEKFELRSSAQVAPNSSQKLL